MKYLSLSIVAAGIALLASAPAKADAVDMSTITCGGLASMKADEVTFILTWVVGYMAGTAEELSMDPAVLGATVNDTVKYCTDNPEMSVLNAAKEVSAK